LTIQPKNWRTSGGLFDLENKEARMAELEDRMLDPDFWNDQNGAQTVINESNALKEMVNEYKDLVETQENLEMTHELLKEENDADLHAELTEEMKKFSTRLENYELQMLLSEQHDKNNAILELHPGAGGTESQDWASLLLRMYTRWAEKRGFKVETMDYLPGDEAGVKSVTLLIKGHNAYGYLKAEKAFTASYGFHHLIHQAAVIRLSCRVK
jgi:peptide chain release factor 2